MRDQRRKYKQMAAALKDKLHERDKDLSLVQTSYIRQQEQFQQLITDNRDLLERMGTCQSDKKAAIEERDSLAQEAEQLREQVARVLEQKEEM